jgi:hypothetical protein
MRRLAWSQLRFGATRSLALLIGMLVAATAFTVLTAASRTSQLRTIGTVTTHFRAAYDILVRPAGTRSQQEQRTGTVQPNFLSGIYGGITMADYHQIQDLPGVQVAAPVAMVGYSLPIQFVARALPAAVVAGTGRALFRTTTTWVSAGGRSRIRQPSSYLYLTPARLGTDNATGEDYETQGSGRKVTVCPSAGHAASPFSADVQASNECWSRVNGLDGQGGSSGLTAGHPGVVVRWRIPMLIAAVDPDAEAKLDGLPHALTSGHYLAENARPGTVNTGGGTEPAFPVLAASNIGIGESAVTQVQQLAAPSGPAVLNAAAMARDAAAPGQTVLRFTVTAQQAYQQLLTTLGGHTGTYAGINEFWSVGSTRYQRDADGALTPARVSNPVSAWRSSFGNDGFVEAPVDNADQAYRPLVSHAPVTDQFSGGTIPLPIPVLAGTFSQSRIASFDPLSQVPLGVYQPTVASPRDAATRQALGENLQPTLNLAGYVSQPVQLVTTLAALPALQNNQYFSGDLHQSDPISVIRVRVAGVTGPDKVSLARIRQVAQQISARTHLTVDIVAGSSPEPTAIDLPAGKFGQPALRLTEGWVHKGVGLAILTAVDRKSVVLFTLILVVCVLFVANSATAAVRGRRRELGVLACLGWTRPRLFATVLGELAGVGLAAGVLGGAVALPAASALGLHPSVARAALTLPVAMAVAIVAGVVPAWIATRADPLAAVRPPVVPAGRARHPRGITGLAVLNVARTPGRTLVGVIGLAVGVAALTLLVAISIAFRGAVIGSLLGDAVTVQVRGVDYVAVTATVLLGVLAVADVVFLNIRERAAELATIRSFGWPERILTRLVVTEGALIGLAGAVIGAGAGLAAAAAFTGQLTPRLFLAAALSAVAGVLLTAAAALPPAQLLRRLPAAQLLAED